jgi:hypothetical protein
MSVFGEGASTNSTQCEDLAASRLTEVTDTGVPAGTTTGAADPAGGISICLYAIFSVLHSKLVSAVQVQCRTMVILRAIATFAFLVLTRFMSRVPQLSRPTNHHWVRCNRTLAASNRYVRNSRSPNLGVTTRK